MERRERERQSRRDAKNAKREVMSCLGVERKEQWPNETFVEGAGFHLQGPSTALGMTAHLPMQNCAKTESRVSAIYDATL